MATFPGLIPSTRTYSPGAFPHSAHGVYDGSEARVRHSNTVLGVRLRLFFPAITSAELLTVIAHYNGQRGRSLPFAIPVELLSGVDTPADFTPAGHQWRYVAKPTVEDISITGASPSNVHNLTVELDTVPPENTITQGARLRVQADLQAGSAQLGAAFNAYSLLEPGQISLETQFLVVAELDVANGAGNPLWATASLDPGTASAGGAIDVASITYTQSSVYVTNTAATNAGMTNGVFAETSQTATNAGSFEHVTMDLGAVYAVATVYVGSATTSLAGGWSKFYTEDALLQHSTDNSTWTTFANTGTFATEGIKTFSVSFNARYIRIRPTNDSGSFLAVTEFYATST